MIYNFKRATWLSVLIYISNFILGMGIGSLLSEKITSLESVPDIFWYIGMVTGLVLGVLFAFWYFRRRFVTPTALSGFLFGISIVAVSFVLDITLFSIGNAAGGHVNLWQYYGDFRFWIITAVTVASSTFIGFLKQQRH